MQVCILCLVLIQRASLTEIVDASPLQVRTKALLVDLLILDFSHAW